MDSASITESVPDDAICVNYALNGNIKGLEYLFSNGLASPKDISHTRGYSLLRWALYGKQYATCEFLIEEGADPDHKPISANDYSPRIKACHFLLEGGLPETELRVLQLIANGHLKNFINEAGFTQAHRIALGLSFTSLKEELKLHPEDLDKPDCIGRTPLSWAAARSNNTLGVKAFLSHGANPNILDATLSGPVSNAAAQGHTACVRLLLEAGASPDARKLPGIRKGSPLNVAARRSNDIELVKILLEFDADIESVGVDGVTPLIHATRNDNAIFAALFLDYGADIHAITVSGATPLTTAITHNSHNVLRLILDKWHDCTVTPRLKGPHLLDISAIYADIETLEILTSTNHLPVRRDNSYDASKCGDQLRQRRDYTEELSSAFEKFLESISSAPNVRNSPDQLAEAACLDPALAQSDASDLAIVEVED